MKYEFSDYVAYKTLYTPANQHPPLWPIIAGSLAKIINTDDTFSILKYLCEIVGVLLVGVVALIDYQPASKPPSTIGHPSSLVRGISICLVSVSAVLVDYSANGSPYILMALWIVLDTWLLLRFDPRKIGHILSASILCTLGILTHMTLLFMPLCFLITILFIKTTSRKTSSPFNSRWVQSAIFIVTLIIGLSPYLVWNIQNFGTSFHSYSSYYLFDKLGLLHTEIVNDVITSRLDFSLTAGQIIQRYLLMAVKSLYALSREFLWVVGPFGVLLFILGIIWEIKSNKSKFILMLLPTGFYLLTLLIWATFKFRFLIPLLPMFSIIAAIGCVYLMDAGKIWRWLAAVCLLGTITWFCLPYLGTSKTLYYGRESKEHNAQYAEMQPLATHLLARPPGTVLGYSNYLDGGIETVYWHRQPFIAGRGLGEMEIKKLAKDFDVRYIWVDKTTQNEIQQVFPNGVVVDQSEVFSIIELAH